MKIGVFPGSFDPITCGHLDIIERASKIFDKVIVGVFVNIHKTPAFSLEERVAFIKEVTSDIPNVTVDSSEGLLVDFVRKKQANIIIRGIRSGTDMEYELQAAYANRMQDKNIETLFITSSSEYCYVSAKTVRELAKFGGNIDGIVPDIINERVIKKLFIK